MNTLSLSKLISFSKRFIILFLIFPISSAHAEYFFVYGPPAPVIDIYDSCECYRPRVHRVCHKKRRPVRRVRRACNPCPDPCRNPCRRCNSSSVSVCYSCPPQRPCCGYVGPVPEPCGGGCGGAFGPWSPCNWEIPDYEVYFAQPPDYFYGEEYRGYSCNPDLATADDDACCNPDMQINY